MKLLFVFTLLITMSAYAVGGGSEVGNGGNVVLCKGNNGSQNAELLDLFEGRALYGFQYQEKTTPALNQSLAMTDQISAYLGSPVSAKNLSEDLKDILKSLHFLPKGVGLQPINDSGHFIAPKNCEVVQTINYRGWKDIYVDSDIWSLLSETQKAALLLHEAIYAFYREANMVEGAELTSQRARYAVAALFSGAKVESADKFKDSVKKSHLRCISEAPYSEFFFYQNGEGKSIAQFRSYFDHAVLTRTWLESTDAKLIGGELISPLEHGVRLQVSFQSATEGTIYDLNARGTSSTKFTCEVWK
jgi:hypothetical protein